MLVLTQSDPAQSSALAARLAVRIGAPPPVRIVHHRDLDTHLTGLRETVVLLSPTRRDRSAMRLALSGLRALLRGHAVYVYAPSADLLRPLGWELLLRQFDPVQSQLSPIRWHVGRKVERYHRRCRVDRKLAEDFARRYRLPPSGEGLRVLDFGSGRGRAAALLGQLGYSVLGMDVSPQPDWPSARNRRFLLADAGGGLPFRRGVFDAVLALGVLQYVPNDEGLLAEFHRVLRPGGRLAVEVTHAGNLYTRTTGQPFDSAVRRQYTAYELRSLVRGAAFASVEVRGHRFISPLLPHLTDYLLGLGRAWEPSGSGGPFLRLVPEGYRGILSALARKPLLSDSGVG